MKTFLVVLFVGLVAAKSKMNKRQFTLSFGTQAPSGVCTGDKLDTCASYTSAVCSNPDYTKWVQDNCCAFCGGGGAPMPGGGTITGGGTMTGGSTTCADKLPNCADYTSSVCSDSTYTQWVTENCAAFCSKCGGSVPMVGSGTGNPVPATGGQPMPVVSGPVASCSDSLANCADYGKSVCTDSNYASWVKTNCPSFCGQCSTSSGTMTGGSGTMTGGTGTMTGGGASATYCMDKVDCKSYSPDICTSADYKQWATENCPVTCHMCGGGGTITGTGTGTGTMIGTGTGTGTMTGSCQDVSANCAMLDQQSHICSDAGAKMYAQQNCAMTCRMCGTSSGGVVGPATGGMTTCADKLPNCASYDPSVCTSADYTQWSQDNCAKTCNKCSGGSTMTGTGTGMLPATGTGSGTGGVISGSSQGCVYQQKVYQQGQTWKDGCKFSCTCADGSTGKYECKQLCVSWNLPDQCSMNPPAAGKCCPTPNCPAGFNVQYPPGYVAQ